MVHVLYIEDDNNNRLLVERVLLAEGYDVTTAASAQLGLELAASQTPDIILMDINMPAMDGFMATAALRQMPHLSRTPIIAVTANVMKGDREDTLSAGCDGYIPKPIDIDRFAEEIENYLRKSSRR